MNIHMNDEALKCPRAMRTFLGGLGKTQFDIDKSQRYQWVARTLKHTRYFRLSKKDKSTVREYIQTMTGYSRSQLTRLIKQYREVKWIGKKTPKRNTFPTRYNRDDILLLIKTDQAHQTLNGAATKKLFERAYNVYGDKDYERLKNISIAHIYNLRKSKTYLTKRRHFTKTNPTSVKIGERKKPEPDGQPGFIRIDTVHQGDLDRVKGLYHINAVDEVTQFEVIVSVEKISERYLIPVLEDILRSFPFKVKGFHSDNGSEYVNHVVAKLLNKLHIEFTKSRARRSNDNGLVESKNGSIVRKYLGYVHIPQKCAPTVNKFYQDHLVPYINYHRPCYFFEVKTNKKGKEKRTYPYKLMMTPYEKLKSLEKAERYLNSGVTFNELDKIMKSLTDYDAAKGVKSAQEKMFDEIFQ